MFEITITRLLFYDGKDLLFVLSIGVLIRRNLDLFEKILEKMGNL